MHRLLWIACLLLSLACPGRVVALHPESPEVKKVIDKAMKFLETESDDRLGAKCLVGLAFSKHGSAVTHPKIKEAIAACQKACQAESITEDIYSTGIAILFLCEIDASTHRKEIELLMKSLEARQKPLGGWGYPNQETGDTSMTQYGVLANWTAYRNGIEISQPSIERVCNWLLRTQDPSGAFGYQGVDPGEGNYSRVPQSEIRNSLASAGTGSLYICADMLQFKNLTPVKQGKKDLPPALVPVDDKAPAAKRPVTARVPAAMMTRGLEDANNWLAKNYRIDQGSWNNYYLYALERYYSFRELAEKTEDDNPQWYNDGYQYLAKHQAELGYWSASSGNAADTAFGALFLMRSTKQSIQKSLKKYGDGQLTGGRGLPSDPTAVTLKMGKIVDSSISGKIDDVVSVLEQGEGSKFEYLVNNPEDLQLADDPAERRDQLVRLRRMAVAGPFESRLTAVKLIGKARDFDSAPTLIFALSDPDARVMRAAEVGLRSVARRFGPSTLPPKASDEQKQAVIESWKKWYASVRPEAAIDP